MSTPLVGLIVSTFCVTCLIFLYRHEVRRGARFLPLVRLRLDYLVLKCAALYHHIAHFFGRDVVRQTIHYCFHTLLRSLLAALRKSERWVRRMLHSNRALAKRAQIERTTRNMLDEISDHKAASALSELEKQKHKERSLAGK